jgi:hypothetical protein
MLNPRKGPGIATLCKKRLTSYLGDFLRPRGARIAAPDKFRSGDNSRFVEHAVSQVRVTIAAASPLTAKAGAAGSRRSGRCRATPGWNL